MHRVACLFGVALIAAVSTVVVAPPSAAEAAPAAPVSGRPVRIMPLGDSITYGQGSSTGSGYRGGLWLRLVQGPGLAVDAGGLKAGTVPDPDHEGHPGQEIAEIGDAVRGRRLRWHRT